MKRTLTLFAEEWGLGGEALEETQTEIAQRINRRIPSRGHNSLWRQPRASNGAIHLRRGSFRLAVYHQGPFHGPWQQLKLSRITQWPA